MYELARILLGCRLGRDVGRCEVFLSGDGILHVTLSFLTRGCPVKAAADFTGLDRADRLVAVLHLLGRYQHLFFVLSVH